jgi:hypothetical protein
MIGIPRELAIAFPHRMNIAFDNGTGPNSEKGPEERTALNSFITLISFWLFR